MITRVWIGSVYLHCARTDGLRDVDEALRQIASLYADRVSATDYYQACDVLLDRRLELVKR